MKLQWKKLAIFLAIPLAVGGLAEKIEAVTLLGKKKMNIYYNNETYQVFGDKKLNLLKYMHLHYIIKNKGKDDEYEFLGL